MDWIVRIGEQEYRTPSTDVLRQWHREGRIRQESVIFHPLLERWMYLYEVEELKGVAHQVAQMPAGKRSVLKPIVIVTLILLAGFVTLTILIALVGSRSDDRPGISQTQERAKIRSNAAADARQKLAALSTTVAASEIAPLCDTAWRLDAKSLTPEERVRCVQAHLAVARAQLGAGRISDARRAFESAKIEGAGPGDLATIERTLAKAEERERKRAATEAKAASERAAKAKAENASAARKAYGGLLRNRFLDKGLDIKVRVHGKSSERITLSFALFSDVWSHRIQKDGLLQELKDMGFKRVDLTDNYDYSVYWDFTKQ